MQVFLQARGDCAKKNEGQHGGRKEWKGLDNHWNTRRFALSILLSVYITSMYIYTIIMISLSWLLPTHTNIHKK